MNKQNNFYSFPTRCRPHFFSNLFDSWFYRKCLIAHSHCLHGNRREHSVVFCRDLKRIFGAISEMWKVCFNLSVNAMAKDNLRLLTLASWRHYSFELGLRNFYPWPIRELKVSLDNTNAPFTFFVRMSFGRWTQSTSTNLAHTIRAMKVIFFEDCSTWPLDWLTSSMFLTFHLLNSRWRANPSSNINR